MNIPVMSCYPSFKAIEVTRNIPRSTLVNKMNEAALAFNLKTKGLYKFNEGAETSGVYWIINVVPGSIDALTPPDEPLKQYLEARMQKLVKENEAKPLKEQKTNQQIFRGLMEELLMAELEKDLKPFCEQTTSISIPLSDYIHKKKDESGIALNA